MSFMDEDIIYDKNLRENDCMKGFGERLKEIRQDLAMSQKDVAEEIGVTPSAYANYEQGTREPNLETLIRLCEALNVTADEILGI